MQQTIPNPKLLEWYESAFTIWCACLVVLLAVTYVFHRFIFVSHEEKVAHKRHLERLAKGVQLKSFEVKQSLVGGCALELYYSDNSRERVPDCAKPPRWAKVSKRRW